MFAKSKVEVIKMFAKSKHCFFFVASVNRLRDRGKMLMILKSSSKQCFCTVSTVYSPPDRGEVFLF